MTDFLDRSPRIGIMCAVLSASMLGAAAGQTKTSEADVQRGLEQLVGAEGGPPGAIATLYSDGRITVLQAGRADAERSGAPRVSDHMRIASVAKAFNGAGPCTLCRRFGSGRRAASYTATPETSPRPRPVGGCHCRRDALGHHHPEQPAPAGELLERLREVQGQPVCVLLGR